MRSGAGMMLRIAVIACVAVSLLPCTAASASSVTVGATATGNGSACKANRFETMVQPSSPSYTVPVGGGAIDSWSTATFQAAAGSPISLLVLAPNLDGSQDQLVGFDNETLPAIFQLDNQATFVPAAPIEVPAGAILGLWSSAASEECDFPDAANKLSAGTSAAPSSGATYSPFSGLSGDVNVSADLVQTVDAGLAAPVAPATVTAGAVAVLTFSLTNSGTSTGRTVVSDTIPSGLVIVGAFPGSGSCASSGQIVTCDIDGVAPGSRVPISLLVRTSTAGSFKDTASATNTNFTDPNAANDTATASLTVTGGPPPAHSCDLIALRGLPVPSAKRLLGELGCSAGKVSLKSSKTIHRGDVISTSPGPGTHAAATNVKIVASAGKPKSKHNRRHG
jgi:uncharacterized repeat protein (TIGR01451 family)